MLLRSLLLAGFVFLFFVPASAQVDDPVGSELSDLEELFVKPFGVRNLAMGWGGVADGGVAANFYYNPANLISHGGFEVAFETQNWFDELDFFNGGAAARFKIGKGDTGKFHIGTAIWYAGQKSEYIELTEKSETTNWYLTGALALGYSTERFEIGIGAAVKPAFVEFESFDQDATAWGFDIGLKFGGLLMDKNGHTLSGFGGASILHLGKDAEAEDVMSELPTEARAGVSFRYGTPLTSTSAQSGISAFAVTLNAEVIDRSLRRDIDTVTGSKNPPLGSMIGAELCFYNVFNLRYGYLDDGINSRVTSETYGFGIQFANEKFKLAADLSHLPEIYSDGPSVTSSGISLAWFF